MLQCLNLVYILQLNKMCDNIIYINYNILTKYLQKGGTKMKFISEIKQIYLWTEEIKIDVFDLCVAINTSC